MTARAAVVIGIGNPYRGDDGIGLVVADGVSRLGLPGVRVIQSDGEPIGLLAAWQDADLAIVVDAIRHQPPRPGRIHRLTASQLSGDGDRASTHGFGVPYALRLSRALRRQPGQLVIIAVEGADFADGSGLSAAVTAAVPAAVAAVRAELAVPGPS